MFIKLLVLLGLSLFACDNQHTIQNSEPTIEELLDPKVTTPVFKVVDSNYKQITQEVLKREFELTTDGKFLDPNIPYLIEEFERKLNLAGTVCYMFQGNLEENLVIESAAGFVNDQVFDELVTNMEAYIAQYLNEGMEMKLVASGHAKYKNLYDHKFMTIHNSTVGRFTHQYFFNFDSKTFSITINTTNNTVDLESIVEITTE